ncbi:MAG: peptide chain release factor 2 [Elusimicrobiota bacterium]
MFEEYAEKIKILKVRLRILGGFFNLAQKKKKYEELKNKSTRPGFWDNSEYAKEIMQEMSSVESDIKLFEKLQEKKDDIKTLLELAREEKEKSLEKEIKENLKKLKKRVEKVSFRLKLSGENDRSDAIVSLSAGAGGTEACDWVEMLTRMYRMWASGNSYETSVIELLPGDEAGIKKITFMVKGDYAYGFLKGETGVHRLVRVSPFDSSGRRHTSFAACDVIPSIGQQIEVNINENDLRVDTYRASGHGGQHVNKTDSAVRITHIPTSVVVQCQDSPSQHANRKKAMEILKARLYEYEKDKQRQSNQRRYDEKGEIGWGRQIRSYVFMPYQMVKDHRTDLKVSNVDSVMDGEIDEFIQAYLDSEA